MYVWLRLARMFATTRSRGHYYPGEESRLSFRCLPTDIDTNLHLNNARYMMLADVGRIDIFARIGLIKMARERNWMPMMGGLQAVYVREIRLWKRFDVISTLGTWQDTQVLGRHRFVLEDGSTAAIIMTTAGIYDYSRRCFMPIDEIASALGVTDRPRPPNQEELTFMETHAGLRHRAKNTRLIAQNKHREDRFRSLDTGQLLRQRLCRKGIFSCNREGVMLSHDKIWAAIDTLAERHSMSVSGLARRSGLDSTAFNKSKRHAADGRPRWPSTESLAKVMEATGSSLTEILVLFGEQADKVERDRVSVPLIGFAQAGDGGFFDDGGFPVGQGWDEIALPTANVGENAYALQVQGDSMLPLYRDGDILIVEPGARIRKGDRVIAKTATGEVMAKIMAGRKSHSVELVSLNPAYPDRIIPEAQIVWLARIIWASQ